MATSAKSVLLNPIAANNPIGLASLRHLLGFGCNQQFESYLGDVPRGD